MIRLQSKTERCPGKAEGGGRAEVERQSGWVRGSVHSVDSGCQ